MVTAGPLGAGIRAPYRPAGALSGLAWWGVELVDERRIPPVDLVAPSTSFMTAATRARSPCVARTGSASEPSIVLEISTCGGLGVRSAVKRPVQFYNRHSALVAIR
jgi:hypothetical protein